MMIGFAPEDGHGAIELLHEEQAHHLMAERHAGKGHFLAGTLVDSGGETVGSTHHKHQPPRPGGATAFHVAGKFYGAKLLAAFIKQHQPIAIRQAAEYLFAFALLLLLKAQRTCIPQIGDDFYAERQIMAQTGGIVGYERRYTAVGRLPDNEQNYLHRGIIVCFGKWKKRGNYSAIRL